MLGGFLPLPKNRAQIEANLDQWRASRGVNCPSRSLYDTYIEILALLSVTEVAVLYASEALGRETE